MLSVKGIFDGRHIYPIEAIRDTKRYKVIITFVEELDDAGTEADSLRAFGAANAALDFWNNNEEDIYQDYLPKVQP